MVGDVTYWMSHKTDREDAELSDWIIDFFKHHERTGQIPTMEKLALGLGTSVFGLQRWLEGRGVSARTRQILLEAKGVIQAIDAALALEGKINPATYIFRAKNLYEMVDQVTHVATVSPESEMRTPEEIARRIGESVPDD
jgi:hypothetical protein